MGGLLRVGSGLLGLGKFDEAHSLLEENLAIGRDLGTTITVATWGLGLGYAKAHLGQYEQARVQAQMGRAFFQERLGREDGFAFFVLGSVALAEQAYAEAGQLLEKSIAIDQRSKLWKSIGSRYPALGYAERGLGQPDQAWQHPIEALRIAAEIKAFMPRLLVLPGIALLLADRGEKKRAVEFYALASRYEFVGNSRWFEDVAGRHIAEAAAALPPDVVAAAQERGRARDLEATAAELLAEFGARASQMTEIHDDERAGA
jgi:tetratricopeptide (TPR) repeat protein